MELNCQRFAFSSASLILGGNICNYFWYNKVINLRLRTALTTDAATARDLIKPAQMGRSRVLNPKNLAEIFNRQLFAAIKMQGDIQSLSLSLSQKQMKMNWKERRLQGYRTENEMISSGWKPNEQMHLWVCLAKRWSCSHIFMEFFCSFTSIQ